MKYLMTLFTALTLAMPVALADHHEGHAKDCSCDKACKERCEKGGNKDHKNCKCSCDCSKTGKCAHGKCDHHDHKDAGKDAAHEKEEKKK